METILCRLESGWLEEEDLGSLDLVGRRGRREDEREASRRVLRSRVWAVTRRVVRRGRARGVSGGTARGTSQLEQEDSSSERERIRFLVLELDSSTDTLLLRPSSQQLNSRGIKPSTR